MWTYSYFAAILLIAQCAQISSGYRVFKFVKLECVANPKYLSNEVCQLKAIRKHKTVCNMEGDIVKELTDVSLHFQVFAKNYANQYNPFLVNVTNNMCDILDKKNFPIYTTLIVNLLKEMSNLNHTCPYSGHLSVKNLYVDESHIPLTIPLGSYKAALRFLEGHLAEEIGIATFYVVVSEERG